MARNPTGRTTRNLGDVYVYPGLASRSSELSGPVPDAQTPATFGVFRWSPGTDVPDLVSSRRQRAPSGTAALSARRIEYR